MTTARSGFLLTTIAWLAFASVAAARDETIDHVKTLYRSAAYRGGACGPGSARAGSGVGRARRGARVPVTLPDCPRPEDRSTRRDRIHGERRSVLPAFSGIAAGSDDVQGRPPVAAPSDCAADLRGRESCVRAPGSEVRRTSSSACLPSWTIRIWPELQPWRTFAPWRRHFSI